MNWNSGSLSTNVENIIIQQLFSKSEVPSSQLIGNDRLGPLWKKTSKSGTLPLQTSGPSAMRFFINVRSTLLRYRRNVFASPFLLGSRSTGQNWSQILLQLPSSLHRERKSRNVRHKSVSCYGICNVSKFGRSEKFQSTCN